MRDEWPDVARAFDESPYPELLARFTGRVALEPGTYFGVATRALGGLGEGPNHRVSPAGLAHAAQDLVTNLTTSREERISLGLWRSYVAKQIRVERDEREERERAERPERPLPRAGAGAAPATPPAYADKLTFATD